MGLPARHPSCVSLCERVGCPSVCALLAGARAAPAGGAATGKSGLGELELSRAAAEHTSAARRCLLPEEPEARRVELEDSCEGPGEGPLAAFSSWWRGSLSRKCPGDRVLPVTVVLLCLGPGCTASLSLRPSFLAPALPLPAGGPAPAPAAESLPRPWGQPSLFSLPAPSPRLAERRLSSSSLLSSSLLPAQCHGSALCCCGFFLNTHLAVSA